MSRKIPGTIKTRYALTSVSLLAALVACSSANDVVLGNGQLTGGDGGSQEEPSSGGATASSGGAAATGGTDATGGTTATGGSLIIVPTKGTGGAGGFEACASITQKAELIGSDIHVMFDQSSSMSDSLPAPAQGSWWDAAQQAFEAFVGSPSISGTGVGLQYFPLHGVAPESCVADYTTPEVPIGFLPGNSAALVASIRAHDPVGFTPMGPALAGAIAHVKSGPLAGQGRGASVVLVTDGFPTECDPQSITGVAEIARQGYESSPQVRTFVIALNVGAGVVNLDTIAAAGGTGKAIQVEGTSDVSVAIESALLSTVRAPVPCRIALPPGPIGGKPIDLSLVNVAYTPAAGPEELLLMVSSPEQCSTGGNYWYLSPSMDGTQFDVSLCPQACTYVQRGSLSVVFGCPTKSPLP